MRGHPSISLFLFPLSRIKGFAARRLRALETTRQPAQFRRRRAQAISRNTESAYQARRFTGFDAPVKLPRLSAIGPGG
ncbi:hypothetical protein [Azohydromonas caseinilytica]|uniref:Uncharacterized protein n=1 Tax=Azohydromonas caseinilytica TaxID=2728836 RepID=A0A848FGZ4_9BURK|nr:hypothetical protein [Azohydromonas caseinilytica]NML17569.1 hypothetical protein [Azohydromonas caseinilytica]